jgi:hypothetical protein
MFWIYYVLGNISFGGSKKKHKKGDTSESSDDSQKVLSLPFLSFSIFPILLLSLLTLYEGSMASILAWPLVSIRKDIRASVAKERERQREKGKF